MTPEELLPDELVARIHDRAAGYDRDNAFFAEDLAELAAAGYLRALVPTRFGGLGCSLSEVVAAQRRLAAAAPATALGVNMHLIWTGVAKTLHDRGDDALHIVLAEAGAGEVFAFAISEAGNDLVLFGSTTEAVPAADGSYAFTGMKVFTTLSPAWTRLGTIGLDTTSDDAPKIVYGIVDRDAGGFRTLDDWDALGMRATQSRTTVLEGATADAAHVLRRLHPGPNRDPLVFAVFANFEILIAAVYAGIGDRALELAIESAHRRRSMRNDGATLDLDADIRRRIAEAWVAQDAIGPQLDALARDLDAGVDHGALWFPKVVGLKVRAVETAIDVVDRAVRVAGGSSYTASSELGRLARDVRAGLFHPSEEDSAFATVATALLGPLP